ncbi:MAG TPA: hypothetical protein VMU22_08425 [Rhizomicrobium sp.]|nr:hypothetical protein [Rhizomicrobium sp.]
MHALNYLRIAAVAMLAVALAACPPVTTKTPVGTTVKASNDSRLTGVWRGVVGEGEGPSYFTFFPQDDGTINVLVATPPSNSDKGGYGVFVIRTAMLGKYHFLNVRQTMDDGKPATGTMADRTFPIYYRYNDDGALMLFLIDETAAKAAVKSGKIAGTIEPGDYGDVMLTAPPGELDAFMASSAGRALFTRPVAVLKRVK